VLGEAFFLGGDQVEFLFDVLSCFFQIEFLLFGIVLWDHRCVGYGWLRCAVGVTESLWR